MGLVTALAIGATVAGSAIAAKSQKKAANTAADAQRDASAQNAQVQREIYGQNKQILSPYIERGNVAGNALLDFYGLTQPQPQATLPTPQPNALAQYEGGTDISPDIPGMQVGAGMPGQFTTMAPQVTGLGAGAPVAAAPQTGSADAFKKYIQNSDYAFKFGEGANDINSGYAGAGMLQSGAAMKDLERFRQNLQSGYRNEWAGGVQNQMGAGLTAGGALAGVGTNYANAMTQNNNALAGALGNAALVKGANNPFASALGAFGGAVLGGR